MGADPQDYDTTHAVIALGGELDVADVTAEVTQAELDAVEDDLDTRLDDVEEAIDNENSVQVADASASNATAVDVSPGHGRTVTIPTLTENTVITVTGLGDGQSALFIITQHASAAKTCTFDGVLFAGGEAYAVSTDVGAVDAVTIVRVGSDLYGFVAGQAMA